MAGPLDQLADLLRCPLTGQRLRIADPAQVSAIASSASGDARDADGFLVREDGLAAYPVVNGIPTLLEESLIPLPPLT